MKKSQPKLNNRKSPRKKENSYVVKLVTACGCSKLIKVEELKPSIFIPCLSSKPKVVGEFYESGNSEFSVFAREFARVYDYSGPIDKPTVYEEVR